nr:cytochrome P450 2J6-like [Pogona vitticeps]
MLAKQYGNIYTLWMGHMPIVVLSGFQAVKEGLMDHSEEFSERPLTPFLEAVGKQKGIIFSNGHTWKQQRRFGLVTLRKLGLGKKGMERQIEEEAQQLVETFARAKGQPGDPSLPIVNSVSNVICALTFGHRFALEDKNFQKLVEAVDSSLKSAGTFFHISKDDPDSAFNEENLAQCIHDFFIAGTETTAVSLRWALLLLTSHPEIQDKVHKELEDVLGSSHLSSYRDLKRLPYTNAVIHEMQRVKYVLILGVPRQCAQDVNMRGFLIPKSCFKTGHLIFLTSLLRTFRFQLPEGVKELNQDPVPGLSTPPFPYKICAVPRNNSF